MSLVYLSVRSAQASASTSALRTARRAAQVGFCALILAGCASSSLLAQNETPSASVPPVSVKQPSEGVQAANGFAKETLYQLLVAEFAGQRGDITLAARHYLDVAQHTRDPTIAERATRIAVFARDERRALEAAKLWSEVNPKALEAKQTYAVLLMRAGRIDEAVAELAKTLSASGDEAREQWYGISDMLSREKDKKSAITVMERLVARHAGDADALTAFAHLLARVGELKQAEALIAKVLSMDRHDVRAAVFYARLLQSQGRTPQALEVLSKALVDNPEDREMRMTYARLLVGAKRYEEALGQFQRLAEDDPEDADVVYALGLLLLQTSHPEQARVQFQHLVEFGKYIPETYYYLGQIAESEGDPAKAMAAYREVDRGEHFLSAQIRVAVLLSEQQGVKSARQYLHGLPVRNAQESVRLHRAEAEVLMEAEQLDEAMSVYDQALHEHPRDTDLQYARAMLAARMDRLERVEADLRDILAREPNNADALNALGYTLADRTDRHDEALELIKRALDLKPGDHYILDSMGWVLYRLGRYQDAVEHLQRAMAGNEEPDPEIAAHLGEVLWVMGKRDAARNIWETALKSTPGDKRILKVMKRFGQ